MTDSWFDGRVAVITGGSSGIGAAAVRRFLDSGAVVVIADVNEQGGQAFAASLGTSKAAFRACDVSCMDNVRGLMDWTAAEFGSIDIVFNNAGIAALGGATDTPADVWRKVIEVDLSSIFYSCSAVIPHMQRQGKGVIVNNASISGLCGDYALGAYNAAKGGVVNYTRALALDHARENIRVNAVCPGAIQTPLMEGVSAVPGLLDSWLENIPMGRVGQPHEIAEVVAFLCSDAASFMTGSIVTIDGGQTAATGTPNFLKYNSTQH